MAERGKFLIALFIPFQSRKCKIGYIMYMYAHVSNRQKVAWQKVYFFQSIYIPV